MSDNAKEFVALKRYTWNAKLFGGVSVYALSSVVWSDVIAVHDFDLSFCGSFDSKSIRHVSDVF